MTISLIFAWIGVLCIIAAAFKYIARISKSAKLNRFFHNIHIPVGIVLVTAGLIHGLLAGNVRGTGLSEAYIGTLIFSFNWGTACFIVSILLGLSYVLRKVLKKNWMRIHRILTIVVVVLLVIHVADVGIQLPSRILGISGSKDSSGSGNGNSASFFNIDGTDGFTSFSGAQLKDGVYEGSAQGYQSTIKVSVTVEGGQVSDIEIIEQNDTPQYFERAKSIVSSIISGQTLDVDAVSGATYSSAGIVNAVNDALQSAVTEGELEKEDYELPADTHGNKGKGKQGSGRKEGKGLYDN